MMKTTKITNVLIALVAQVFAKPINECRVANDVDHVLWI
jgi:hypothetical protein